MVSASTVTTSIKSASTTTPYSRKETQKNAQGSRLMTKNDLGIAESKESDSRKGSVLDLCFSIGGIYASFLTWALLQERISAQGYGPENEIFKGSLVINTIQSFLAMLVGYVYMSYKTKKSSSSSSVENKDTKKNTKSITDIKNANNTKTAQKNNNSVFSGNTQLLKELVLVAVSQSLASPFGYASLAYVNYLTLLLAKSCKLVPVMLIHLTLYRRKFPLYKYAVVFAITCGVFMFTYYKQAASGASSAKKAAVAATTSSSWTGLGLLGINLLLDGVTNSTQDHIFQKHKKMTGPHMMFGLNGLATLLTASYLILSFLVLTSLDLDIFLLKLGLPTSQSFSFLFSPQLQNTLFFVYRNGPRVLLDVTLFGLCGALGQVFIFHTLEKYGSLILVTVTVTRKMMSMLLSVVWFGHSLSVGQWLGVAAVFGGIGAEAAYKYKQTKDKQKKN